MRPISKNGRRKRETDQIFPFNLCMEKSFPFYSQLNLNEIAMASEYVDHLFYVLLLWRCSCNMLFIFWRNLLGLKERSIQKIE